MVQDTPSFSTLEKDLGYQFQERGLLEQALTHRSYGAQNNERLEFLGDAILNFVIAHALYERFVSAHEGQLSRLRARLVRRQTLAEMAREISLGKYLIMGTGELKSGGFSRDSILSDALEGIIGAIYIDGGLESAQSNILVWFRSRIEGLSLDDSQKDSKTRLQEFLQSQGAMLPEYVVTAMIGKAPDQEFTVECRSEVLTGMAQGKGGNRRIAEQMAATNALHLLGVASEGSGEG
ncbi:MAG: ribonuclease III [Gammaproteobacteria bacterium]|nr:ribonuclease III [Gammaproteobacteria bacterium]